jgi:hypothetical protein
MSPVGSEGWGGGIFNTKSVYDHLTISDSGNGYKHIWKAKIPYKIKIYGWLLENNAILTRDNIINKRKWTGDPSCLFCPQFESREHLCFDCPFARCVWGIIATRLGTTYILGNIQQYKTWVQKLLPGARGIHHFGFAAISWALWKCRNRACFDKKIIRHPAEVIICACAFMSYWTGLGNTTLQQQVDAGVKTMLSITYNLLARQKRGFGLGGLGGCRCYRKTTMMMKNKSDRCSYSLI